MPRVYRVLFVVSTPLAGLTYWWCADWWAYVGEGPDRWPKFEMPWWWQVIESLIVGSVTGGMLVGVAALIRASWAFRR